MKVAGALVAATGIVVVGAVVASGAAAGSMVEGTTVEVTDENKNVIIGFACLRLEVYNKSVNKKVYNYREEEGFLRGMTSWEPELVCENAVEVVREVKIQDLYSRLLDMDTYYNL